MKMIADIFAKYKKDICIISALIIAGAVLGAVLLHKNTGIKGEVCQILVDGEVKYTLPLCEDITVEVDGVSNGHNTVIIKNGKVRIENASCPDRLCVKMGEISYNNQSIICLPNRVVVNVKSEKKSDYDAKVW